MKSKTKPKMLKGFACMNSEQKRQICSLGGKAVLKKYGVKHLQKLGRKGGKG